MAALMAATLLSSCEEEEKAARDLTGVWEITDPIFVDTNVFTHFNMKRVPNPDWSTITEWGINNRLQ